MKKKVNLERISLDKDVSKILRGSLFLGHPLFSIVVSFVEFIILDSNRRLVRLRNWFLPLLTIKSFDYTNETCENLIKELKNQINESIISEEFSPGLITLLRIIQYLSIPSDNQFVLGAKIELKYDYMLLKLYSHGIYSLLINILEVRIILFFDFSFVFRSTNRNVLIDYYLHGK